MTSLLASLTLGKRFVTLCNVGHTTHANDRLIWLNTAIATTGLCIVAMTLTSSRPLVCTHWFTKFMIIIVSFFYVGSRSVLNELSSGNHVLLRKLVIFVIFQSCDRMLIEGLLPCSSCGGLSVGTHKLLKVCA